MPLQYCPPTLSDDLDTCALCHCVDVVEKFESKGVCQLCHRKAKRRTRGTLVPIYGGSATSPEHRRFKKYGLTPDDYADLLVEQQGCCAICANPFDSAFNTHTDHSHETGEVRGLLCNTCNVGLGMFKDNAALLIQAARYLNK